MDQTLFLIIKYLNKNMGSTTLEMIHGMYDDPEFNYQITLSLLKRRLNALIDKRLVVTIVPDSAVKDLVRYRLTLRGYSLVGKDIDSKAWQQLRRDISADCQSPDAVTR